jgi:hypothetical protein
VLVQKFWLNREIIGGQSWDTWQRSKERNPVVANGKKKIKNEKTKNKKSKNRLIQRLFVYFFPLVSSGFHSFPFLGSYSHLPSQYNQNYL